MIQAHIRTDCINEYFRIINPMDSIFANTRNNALQYMHITPGEK
jgi:hypothetical protein